MNTEKKDLEKRNLMETLLEEKYNQIVDSIDCCHCAVCKNDIILVALNKLPSRYTSTSAGETISRANLKQYEMELVAALHYAAGIVKEKPRH